MKEKYEKLAPLVLVGLAVGACMLGLALWIFPISEPASEIYVKIVEIGQPDNDVWLVTKEAVGEQSRQQKSFVVRLKHLQTERLAVEITGEANDNFLIRSDDLRSGEMLVLTPESVPIGKAVIPIAGLSEEHLVRLTLEAGMAAAMAEDLDQSVRFISTEYSDDWGFNRTLMRKLLKKAYKEFDEPRIELAEPVEIQIEGNQAMAQAKVRLSAIYEGRRNYLLGEREVPNHILVRLDKSNYGWKVSAVKGLRPLGFEERFFRLLGANVGLPLSESEGEEKDKTCMSCRERMVERFGATN
ncbi:MAG: hypothetical protein JRF24_08725 [Deltaproteobacteria bacterium]|nr:hypothetical protein [Deltaproteobacteria bacterium]